MAVFRSSTIVFEKVQAAIKLYQALWWWKNVITSHKDNTMISPLAYVDPTARIGQNVEIMPFAYIEGDVTIGDNCVIMPHVSILNGTTIGNNNTIHQNTVICAKPQSFHYEEGGKPHVVIGDHNVIREKRAHCWLATNQKTPHASAATITS